MVKNYSVKQLPIQKVIYKVKIKAQKEGTSLTVTAKDKAGNQSKATTVKVK